MPRKLAVGETVRGYKVLDFLGSGLMATSYSALSPSGERVFLKQYKSPTVSVDWYPQYVAYQQEIKRRVESSRFQSFSYRFIEFFESEGAYPCYFQAFEFVERGHDLQTAIAAIRECPGTMPFDRRLILARVMMAGIDALHEAGIVHSDLKPANVFLFEDPTIKAGYHLKIIDMDYSLLVDRPAPWSAEGWYAGTPGYLSPEHVVGQKPSPASDVFTCGLMLYELLADRHPYELEGEAYATAVQAYGAPPPRLAGTTGSEEALCDTLHRCLHPDPVRRPTARQVNEVLRRKPTVSVPPVPPPEPAVVVPAPVPVPSPEPVAPPDGRLRSARLRLVGEAAEMSIGVRTDIGQPIGKKFGEDSRFLDSSVQYSLERTGDGWRVVPNAAAPNDTLLNGKAIREPAFLHPEDVLGVGREAKGIVKLPLTVREEA